LFIWHIYATNKRVLDIADCKWELCSVSCDSGIASSRVCCVRGKHWIVHTIYYQLTYLILQRSNIHHESTNLFLYLLHWPCILCSCSSSWDRSVNCSRQYEGPWESWKSILVVYLMISCVIYLWE
jgi:hypothetical protein